MKAGLPVISIAPPGRLAAELLLPTRSSGFIRPGQQVRLHVDAFPFQRYGAVLGVVEQISRASVAPGEYAAPIRFEEASYRLRVRINAHEVRALRTTIVLQPGMTVTGSIVADRRTLMQWLFDPILAIRESI